MDFIIDLQGFRDKENGFLPKEVAIISLQGSVVGHWIIAPPHDYKELPSEIKTSADYVSTHLSGIRWFDGETAQRKLRYHFYNIARKAKRIYVRGAEKARYVQGLIARSVINLEEYSTGSTFSEMQRQFNCDNVCCFHTYLDDDYKKNYCALRRAYLLKAWLRALLFDKLGTDPTNASSEDFNVVLESLIHGRKSRVQFQSDIEEGKDEVDENSDNETTCLKQ